MLSLPVAKLPALAVAAKLLHYIEGKGYRPTGRSHLEQKLGVVHAVHFGCLVRDVTDVGAVARWRIFLDFCFRIFREIHK